MQNKHSAVMARTLLSWRLLPVITLLAVQPAPASEQILFEPSQFGAVDLVPKQSASEAVQLLEALGAKSDRFEPISEFRPDDPIRKLGQSVGRLDVLMIDATGHEGVEICTATLIDRDIIITNHHCIPGEDGTRVTAAKIRFGYLELGSTSSAAFDVDVSPIETSPKLDYSILRVKGAPTARFGIALLKPRAVVENERLLIIHHPAGQPQRLTRAFCRAYPTAPVVDEFVHHQCDTLPGSSGSLLFAQADYAFVGLHHAGGLTPFDPKSFNEGIDAVALTNASSILRTLRSRNAGVPALPKAPVSVQNNKALIEQAATYLAAKEWDNAIDAYDEAIGLNPKDAELFQHRGEANLGRHAYDAAIKDYDAAIHLDPEFAEHYYNRAVAHFGQHDYYAAIKDLNKTIRLNFHNRSLAYYLRGEAKQHTRDQIGGQADIAKARKIDSNVGK